MKARISLLSTMAATCLMATLAQASIDVSGPITTTGGNVAFTQPFDITITTAGTARGLVLDEWVTSDATFSDINLTPATVSYRLNGGSLQSVSFGPFYDNNTFQIGDLTANDGYFYISSGGISVSMNDVITFETQSWTTNGNADWNPGAIQNFKGNVFVMDSSGNALSGPTSVPEPAGILILGAGALALLSRRRHAV